MIDIPYLTVSGVDERTDLDLLAEKLNGIEFGVLYTFDPEGRPRYPSPEFITTVFTKLKRVALHVCGFRARCELIDGKLGSWVHHASRVQVNGPMTEEVLRGLTGTYPGVKFITQHNLPNEALHSCPVENHQLLVDASGGRGQMPAQWRAPLTQKPVGFAGGLTPDNLVTALPAIIKVSRPGWWIDMEKGVRTDDWFDVQKVALVVVRVSMIMQGLEAMARAAGLTPRPTKANGHHGPVKQSPIILEA